MAMKPIYITDPAIDSLVETSISATLNLIQIAKKKRTFQDRANRKRINRLFKDTKAISVTNTLTDEVIRITSPKAAFRIFKRVVKDASVKGFGLINALGMRFLKISGSIFPNLVIKVINKYIRYFSRDLILPAESNELNKHLISRKSSGIGSNINVLGEAVLGQNEANDRLNRLIEMIRRPEVDYVSVKLSAVVAQMITINYHENLNNVAEKLRQIYKEAKSNKVFINLDMEEYRDLRITIETFMKVLMENEFKDLSAGIVLQAYLPEAHDALDGLITFAKNRVRLGGAKIKIRLVKGANLAMERAEAELHGYAPAPYKTKAEVDASYLRLIDVALRPENANVVRIGIASHNLFNLCWALEIGKFRNVSASIDIEMLEGMANVEAMAINSKTNNVLLYTPVTNKNDFASAVAYLVRRLDENTSLENYLRASFEIESNTQVLSEQVDRFKKSVVDRHSISTKSFRHGVHEPTLQGFYNQCSGDPTNPAYINSVVDEISLIKSAKWQIPIVINGKTITLKQLDGYDPGYDNQIWYSYSVADRANIDLAIQSALVGHRYWNSLDIEERKQIMINAAQAMQRDRAKTLALMARDTGKTISEGDYEVSEAIDFARYYSTFITPDKDSYSMGVVVVTPPWNFPYAIPAGGVLAALAAGNSVILKPAPEAVATAYLLAKQLWESGVPSSALQFLPTEDNENGKYLITHPEVAAVILTGGFETAKLFQSWKPNLNLLAETSGKNSIIVSECSDIDLAVKDLVHSAFGHAGQKCSAASLGIIIESVFNNPAFLRQLIDDVNTLQVGAGWDLSTSIGPIIKRPDGALLRALTTLDEGESWLIQPKQLNSSGTLWSPGVKVGIKPGSWSHKNEWFGPVLGLMVAPNLETAIIWQNSSEFGLTAGIHSLDTRECELWMETIEAGNAYINRGITGAIVQRQPFGGWKRSSVGANAKAGGPNYVNSLRTWKSLIDFQSAKWSFDKWWLTIGSQALDISGLTVEKNYFRYRKPLSEIIIRIDESVDVEVISFIKYIAKITETQISWSSADSESIDSLIHRAFSKVRWLSGEEAPTDKLLEKGVSLDTRPVTQRGDIEGPRWLLEQSVSMAYHRYGNIKSGPKPICHGLSIASSEKLHLV